MSRADLTNHLVHWTSGDDYEEAYDNILNMVLSRKITGSSKNIKGNHVCVCFTESPENEFHKVITKYRPFGIQVPKAWLFEIGGRPVIYESDEEFDLLPQHLQWRHVRYEPCGQSSIDFTWEREWRFNDFELQLDPRNMRVLLPPGEWAQRLVDNYHEDKAIDQQFSALAYNEEYCGYIPEDIPFAYSVINA